MNDHELTNADRRENQELFFAKTKGMGILDICAEISKEIAEMPKMEKFSFMPGPPRLTSTRRKS